MSEGDESAKSRVSHAGKSGTAGLTLLTIAGAVSADLDTLGDGLLIEDAVSGLQWADWSEHPANISISDFFTSSQWAGNGFRLTTESEIITLFTNAGADSFSYGNWNAPGVGSIANPDNS